MYADDENRLLTPIEIGQHPNVPEGPVGRHSFRHQVGQITGELHVIPQRLVIADHVTLNTKLIVVDPAKAADLGNNLQFVRARFVSLIASIAHPCLIPV